MDTPTRLSMVMRLGARLFHFIVSPGMFYKAHMANKETYFDINYLEIRNMIVQRGKQNNGCAEQVTIVVNVENVQWELA